MGLAIKSAIEDGAEEYDMLHGDESYKFQWAKDVRELEHLELYAPDARATMARRVRVASRAFRTNGAAGAAQNDRRSHLGGSPARSAGRDCTVRGNLKSGFASAAHLCHADRLYATLAGQRREAVVLGYHRVVADFEREVSSSSPSMLVSRAMLERHLDWLARRFQVVSLDELRSRLEGGSRGDRPIAAITFDDGYRDVYEQAFPLLMRKGLPATVFVATDYVGTEGVLPHDKLYLLLERASHRWRSFSRQLLRSASRPRAAPSGARRCSAP